jgi:O-antigen/teichoic acid export membrane protein
VNAVATAARGRLRMSVPVAGNVLARLLALAALAGATVLVARAGGPRLVGAFTLLRVLPALVGVLVAAGLPSAAPFFLASRPDHPALRPTLVALTCLGAAAASVVWLALSPALHRLFFSSFGPGVVLAASAAVFSQLFVAVGKSLLQGSGDMSGANAAIVAEEAAFLPLYAVLLPLGRGTAPLMVALVAADVAVAVGIGERLRRAGFFRYGRRVDYRLGREICEYGVRGQLGGLLSLVNLRLDVAILGMLAGPGVLGVYAVASKFAELLRLPGLAVNYVLYPAFARDGAERARARTRSLLPAATGLNVLGVVPLALAAAPVMLLMYGPDFHDAILPAWILLAGLVGDAVAELIGAYLYGIRRPGLNSLAIGVGVVVTVVADLVLIPRHGAIGAAIASDAAYLTTVGTLLACFAATRTDRTRRVDEEIVGAASRRRRRRAGVGRVAVDQVDIARGGAGVGHREPVEP